MKKVLLLVALVFSSLTVFAQEEMGESELVGLSSRTGELIKKEFYPLGNVKTTSFEIATITDISTNTKNSFLRIKVATMGVMSKPSDIYTGVISENEIDDCIKTLTFIGEKLITTNPDIHTECEYRTIDGVKLGAYSGRNSWNLYLKVPAAPSSITLKAEDLSALIAKFTEAKEKIASLK